jgi:hypothetical protein
VVVHHFARYLTANCLWRTDDYAAMNFVKALKGEPLRGWASLRINSHTLMLRQNEPETALPWFSQVVANSFAWDEGRGFVLCPIPDSGCTVTAGRSSKTRLLADSIASHLPQIGVWDSIRWREALQKAHEGGPRDPAILFSNIESVLPVPRDKTIILVDDVCTTGGHLRAIAAFIGLNGGSAPSAICAARTAQDQSRDALGLMSDELEPYTPFL